MRFITKHNKLFGYLVWLTTSIPIVVFSGTTVIDWQFWAILVLLVIASSGYYLQGRAQGKKFCDEYHRGAFYEW